MPRSGVAQGSALGPVLFLFNINDIVENINPCIRPFADDIIICSALSCADNVL